MGSLRASLHNGAQRDHHHGDTRLPGTAERIGRDGRAAAARPVPRKRISGAFGRADAAHRDRRLDFHAEERHQAGEELELGGVQRAAADQDDARHPLRDDLVEVRHRLGGRARRRHSRRCRYRAADRTSRWRIPTTATPPTCRPPISSAARRWSRCATRASRSRRTMAGQRGCLCRISISGSRPSGSTGCSSPRRTSWVSGNCAAITATAIRGESSATPND